MATAFFWPTSTTSLFLEGIQEGVGSGEEKLVMTAVAGLVGLAQRSGARSGVNE